jgi:hypothetical protein
MIIIMIMIVIAFLSAGLAGFVVVSCHGTTMEIFIDGTLHPHREHFAIRAAVDAECIEWHGHLGVGGQVACD